MLLFSVLLSYSSDLTTDSETMIPNKIHRICCFDNHFDRVCNKKVKDNQASRKFSGIIYVTCFCAKSHFHEIKTIWNYKKNHNFLVSMVAGSFEQDTYTKMQPDFFIWKIKVCILMHLHFIHSRAMSRMRCLHHI